MPTLAQILAEYQTHINLAKVSALPEEAAAHYRAACIAWWSAKTLKK
jgi:patatin-like phospholipase/acyl hydrolase